jgi:hypothetical protein
MARCSSAAAGLRIHPFEFANVALQHAQRAAADSAAALLIGDHERCAVSLHIARVERGCATVAADFLQCRIELRDQAQRINTGRIGGSDAQHYFFILAKAAIIALFDGGAERSSWR